MLYLPLFLLRVGAIATSVRLTRLYLPQSQPSHDTSAHPTLPSTTPRSQPCHDTSAHPSLPSTTPHDHHLLGAHPPPIGEPRAARSLVPIMVYHLCLHYLGCRDHRGSRLSNLPSTPSPPSLLFVVASFSLNCSSSKTEHVLNFHSIAMCIKFPSP